LVLDFLFKAKICKQISELSTNFGIGRFYDEKILDNVKMCLQSASRNAGVLVYKV